MRFCSSSGQNIGQYIGHIAAGCSYQHNSCPTVLRVHIVQNSKEYFEKWMRYLKLKKNKMVKIQDGRYGSGLYKKMVCPPHVWMPPVHIKYKESMFCQTKGVSIYPIHLDAPCMLGCPSLLDGLLYVWMPPYVWMPCMLGHSP